MNIEQKVNDICEELIDIRRYFHMYPELSEKEENTQKKICEYLEKWNVGYTTYKNSHAVVAMVEGKKAGSSKDKTVAARADIDALPLIEKTNVAHKSTIDGMMHACGHDAHMTILLGCCKVLKELENEFSGNVKFLFQPAEETVGGAKYMVEQGCMKNPDVDYVVGLHVQPGVEVGKVELRYNNFYACTEEFDIVVHGKASHAALPEESIDAIVIASNIVSSLQSVVSRNVSPLDSAVISIGTINGGTKANIICDEVVMHGILRTTTQEANLNSHDMMNRICNGIAQAYGGKCELIFKNGYELLTNDNEVVDTINNIAKEIIGENNIIVRDKPVMLGEDFGYFLDECKGAYYHLGCGNSKLNINEPLHSDKFDMDENCLKLGVLMQVKLLITLLDN